MSGYGRSELEALLGRGSKTIWMPRPGEAPDATLARTSPPTPPWWLPWRRRSLERARAHARAQFKATRHDDVWAVPLWVADNDTDEPLRCWKLCLAVADHEGLVALVDDLDDAATVALDRWAAFSFTSSDYGYVAVAGNDDAVFAERFGHWMATQHDRSLIDVHVVTDGGPGAVLPKPTTPTPAWGCLVAAAIDEAVLPEPARAAMILCRTDLEYVDDDDDDDDGDDSDVDDKPTG